MPVLLERKLAIFWMCTKQCKLTKTSTNQSRIGRNISSRKKELYKAYKKENQSSLGWLVSRMLKRREEVSGLNFVF